MRIIIKVRIENQSYLHLDMRWRIVSSNLNFVNKNLLNGFSLYFSHHD